MIAIFSSDENSKLICETLKKNNLQIGVLVTENPKRAGRGLKLTENPAYKYAKKNNIEIIAPENIDSNFKNDLKKIISQKNISLGIVFSYGKIISMDVINLFEKKIINIHPSLLPKYRGATPIQSAILNGDKKTGYTIIIIDEGCDTGKILSQKEILISEDENYTHLKDKIMKMAINDLPKVVKKYLKGEIEPVVQQNNNATYTKKIIKVDGTLKSGDSASFAHKKIRAFNEFPKSYFEIENKKIIVHEAHLENNKLIIDKIQMPGKSIIEFSQFKNGYSNLLTKFPPYVKI